MGYCSKLNQESVPAETQSIRCNRDDGYGCSRKCVFLNRWFHFYFTRVTMDGRQAEHDVSDDDVEKNTESYIIKTDDNRLLPKFIS